MSTTSLVKKLAIPRYTGSSGEKLARNLISKEFKKLNFTVKEEVVKYIKSDDYYKSINLSFIWLSWILISLSGFLHPLIAVTLFVIYYIVKTKVYPKIELKLAKDLSVNLIASKDTRKKYRLIICGHYDSSKVMRKFIQRNLKLFMNIFPFITLAFYSFILLIFFKGISLLYINEFDVFKIGYLLWMGGIWGIVWGIFTISFGILSLVLTYFFLTSPNTYSNGADDNTSGVVVMIKIAKALKALNLKMGVDFVFFTAEERGAWGSRNWIDGHIRHLDKDKTYFLNIDCVGRGESFFLTKGLGKVFKKKSDPMLCGIVEDVCNEVGYRLEICWGAVSDDIQLLERSLRVCSIMRCNIRKDTVLGKITRKCFFIPVENNLLPFMDWVHTENDVAKDIDEHKLEETTKLVVKIIEKLNKTLYKNV